MAAGRRLPFAALGFAVAAALSAWNPLSAPFGLLVGLVAAALSLRALTLPTRRRWSVAALVVALGAAVGSAFVLALTAGVVRDTGEVVVSAPSPDEVTKELDAAEARTRAARERAEAERRKLEAR
jgi:hypothetical protein